MLKKSDLASDTIKSAVLGVITSIVGVITGLSAFLAVWGGITPEVNQQVQMSAPIIITLATSLLTTVTSVMTIYFRKNLKTPL